MDLAPTPHSCIEKSLCRTVSFYGELPQVYRHYNLVPNLIVLLEQHQVRAAEPVVDLVALRPKIVQVSHYKKNYKT